MALIRSISRSKTIGTLHPTEVDAEWAQIELEGHSVFQLSTFGSDERKSVPKVSQTFQLNETMAQALVDSIVEVFPNLRYEG